MGAAPLAATAAQLTDVRQLRRQLLSTLLPAAPALLDLATHHLPTPTASQCARAARLCPPADARTGAGTPPTAACDPWTRAVGACDAAAALVLYASKSVPLPGSKAQAAVCRVFSGTVRPGMEVSRRDRRGSRQRAARSAQRAARSGAARST